MDLYLIRHADALSLDEAAVTDDADRPLSEKGRAQCRALAAALQRFGARFDVVLSSPLLRARQTQDGFLAHWEGPPPDALLCKALSPDVKPRKLLRKLFGMEGTSVGLVGHMPDLADFAGWLIGSKKVQIDLAKAGVACIACPDGPGKGRGILQWLVTPDWYAVAGESAPPARGVSA